MADPDCPGSLRDAIGKLGQDLSADFRDLRTWLDVDPGLMHFRPRPGAWSIAQILEHVALANGFLLLLVAKIHRVARKRAQGGGQLPLAEPRFEHLDALGSPAFPWKHPEHMTPAGELGGDELRERLERQEQQCLGYLRGMPSGEGCLHRIRLSLLGGDERLDLYQYLYFIGVHMRRHIEQMKRNRAEAGR